MNIETRIIVTIQSVLDKRSGITLDSSLIDDLMVDSLDKLMILSALEDEFSITISEDDFADVLTIKDIVVKIEARGL